MIHHVSFLQAIGDAAGSSVRASLSKDENNAKTPGVRPVRQRWIGGLSVAKKTSADKAGDPLFTGQKCAGNSGFDAMKPKNA